MNNNSMIEDFERAISYNIINTHKTIQQVEKDCEKRIFNEKSKCKEKEYYNKSRIKQLAT
jgi:hypothetical protein